MNIKPPSGVPPTNFDSQTVEPSAPSRDSRPAQSSPSQSVLLKLSPNLFQLGQILDLVVAKLDRDSALLLLQSKVFDKDGQPLKLQFNVPRNQANEIGQRITAKVSQLQDNMPKLTVIATEKPTLPINSLLSQAQAKQQPLQQLMDGYAQVTNKNNVDVTLPREVNDRIQTLWRALPESAQMQKAHTLKHSIQHAGPFLESQLLQASSNERSFFPATDTKTNLLRIAEAIRQHVHSTPPTQDNSAQKTSAPQHPQAPANQTATSSQAKPVTVQVNVDPDIPVPSLRQHAAMSNLSANQILEVLLQQTEGSLQRTLTHQLQMHLHNHDNPRPQLIVEIPIRNDQNGVDVFDLRIHPDQEAPAGQEPDTDATTWMVMMSFNLDGLGPVRAQVSFCNGQVSTNWWAEQAETVALFKNNLETLQNRLSHVGAEVDKLHCQHGLPKIQEAPVTLPYSDSYLDEQT